MNPFDILLVVITTWLATCVLATYAATRPIKVIEPPAAAWDDETWDEHADRVLGRL